MDGSIPFDGRTDNGKEYAMLRISAWIVLAGFAMGPLSTAEAHVVANGCEEQGTSLDGSALDRDLTGIELPGEQPSPQAGNERPRVKGVTLPAETTELYDCDNR
jgi:hypothetical protein